MSLRAALAREQRRLLHDRVALLLIFVAPAIVIALLAAVFSSEVPRDLPIVVVDQDHSSFSRRLTRMLDASSTLRVTTATDHSQAEREIERGGAYAIVQIPHDSERALKRGQAVTVLCSYNAQLLLPASLIRRAVRTVVATASAGVEIRVRTARGATTAEAMTRFEPVRVELHSLFNPRLSYVAFLLTALVPAMLQVFVVMASVWVAGLELRDGTASEWLSGAGGLHTALAAKAIPLIAIYTATAVGAEAMIVRAFGVPLHFTLTLVTAMLLFVTASVAVGFAIVFCAANLRFGLSVGAFYSGPAFAFAGVTFPLAGMPAGARAWSAAIPLTHVLQILSATSRQEARSPLPTTMLILIGLSAGTIAVLRGRTVLRDAAYWGRK